VKDVTVAEVGEALGSMRTHITAHGMWNETPPDLMVRVLAVQDVLEHGAVTWDEDCPYCGLTLIQMLASVRRGYYPCAYSRRFV